MPPTRLFALPRMLALLGLGLATWCGAASPGWSPTRTAAHTLAYAVATDTGAMTATEPVHVAVSLQLRDRSSLNALTDQIVAGKSGAVLSPQQFLARHAPTVEQANRVAAYLTSKGFRNVAVADNRLLVTADGTPASIRAAFQAEMHHFDVRGRQAYANVTDANVPVGLADTVLAVVGLQTVHQAHTHARRASLTPSASAQSVVGLDPTLFAGIYGASGMPSASTATLGIITQGSMNQTLIDLASMAARSGYPAPSVNVVTVGRASSDTAGTDEWNLDTQTSLAAAGGTVQGLVLYTAPTLNDADLTAAYNKAVGDNLAKVVNISLGECEASAQASGTQATDDQIFQAAVAQGQTFSVSSGDSGAYECGGATSAQSYPAVSPYVMALGGTTLSSSGGTWLFETAWSCTGPTTCPQSAAGGTGGGASTTEPAPSWQTASGVLGTAGRRGVPDIAFDASPASGALILINGALVQIGGTSLAAPLFTGFYARIQAAHGNSLGFPASALYTGAAANPSWFHDITAGGNGAYSAGAGWDYVTGFGSLQVQNFSSALGSATPTTWTTIATEGQTFSVNGTQTVRYGNGNSWITLSVTNGGTCSNSFFGSDPLYGTVKICQVAAGAAVSWSTIAVEGQSFTVSGTQTVRFGSDPNWISMSVTGGGNCTNAFFGSDPFYGTVKQCQVATVGGPAYTFIASEGQSFTVNGTQTVRFGSGSNWISKSVTASGQCTNAFFGSDPDFGVVKECELVN